MADSWMEPRTRIPFVGIVAMVLIVAVVAIFLKTQLEPLFPKAEVTVEDETALTGRATSESFYGMREVDLHRQDVLAGSLSRKGGALTFSLDAEERMLTITDAGIEEEIILYPRDGLLKAYFEHNGIDSVIVIDPVARSLTFGSDAATPIEIGLDDAIIYTGSFTHKGTQHKVVFTPAASEVVIGSDSISLADDGRIFTGAWTTGKTSKPVTIDIAKELLTIEDVY